jgi:uncharacterized protein (DUF58 family)
MSSVPDYMRLLPAETLGRLGRLGVVARTLVEGKIAGRHKSPYKGISVEFAEHRLYTRGDDLRNLDWRIYGKVDRYYVKQYIEETNLRATMVVDASGSMGYAGTLAAPIDGRPASKLAYAQHLAAILSYLLVGQQDAVGLVTFDTQIRGYLPARNRSSQTRLLLEMLHQTKPGAETNVSAVLDEVAERIPRRGMVFILSDLFDASEPLLRALHHFHYKKHDVIVLHIMAEEELTFPFQHWTNFRSLETAGVSVQLDPRSLRAVYLDRVRSFLKTLETSCGQMRITYVPMNTKVPYTDALAEFLSRRQGH